jgi:hypothetical protein
MTGLYFFTALAAETSQWDGVYDDVASFKSLETVFANILTIAAPLAGIVVFIMLIAGGFKLLFSGGNPETVKKATGTITWAVFGLVIMLAIWFIFKFVEEFTGVKITILELPEP